MDLSSPGTVPALVAPPVQDRKSGEMCSRCKLKLFHFLQPWAIDPSSPMVQDAPTFWMLTAAVIAVLFEISERCALASNSFHRLCCFLVMAGSYPGAMPTVAVAAVPRK